MARSWARPSRLCCSAAKRPSICYGIGAGCDRGFERGAQGVERGTVDGGLLDQAEPAFERADATVEHAEVRQAAPSGDGVLHVLHRLDGVEDGEAAAGDGRVRGARGAHHVGQGLAADLAARSRR